MRKIPNEQPPISIGLLAREWLTRLVLNINASIDQIHDLDPTLEIPKDPQGGMMRYFPVAILPEITSSGFWGYDAGGWTKLN